MKKYVITVICLIAVLLCAGCGRQYDEGEDSYAERYASSGTIVDSGAVKAVCPPGWNPVDAYDYKTSTKEPAKNILEFVKGGTSVSEGKPFIRIQSWDPEVQPVYPDRNLYAEVSELATFTAGSYTWDGFTGVIDGQRFAWLYSRSNQSSLEVWLFMHTGEEVEAYVTDSDVFMVLESIAVSK